MTAAISPTTDGTGSRALGIAAGVASLEGFRCLFQREGQCSVSV